MLRAMMLHPKPLLLVLGLCLAACEEDGGGDLGAPCETDEDCMEGLACDLHGGVGSCQEPHEH